MDYIGIEINRDGGYLCFLANNGVIQSKIATDWEWEDVDQHLKEMGKALRKFPKKVPARYSHEFRGEDDVPYLVLSAYADNSEHVLLEVTMRSTSSYSLIHPEANWPRVVSIFESITSNEWHKYHFDGERLVSFTVEPLAIRRLGELFLKYLEKNRDTGYWRYHVIGWSPNPDNDVLIESDYRKREQPKLKRPKLDPALKEWERLRRKHPTAEEIERKEIAKQKEFEDRKKDWYSSWRQYFP